MGGCDGGVRGGCVWVIVCAERANPFFFNFFFLMELLPHHRDFWRSETPFLQDIVVLKHSNRPPVLIKFLRLCIRYYRVRIPLTA